MRQFLAIASLSVLAFAAGYGVRIWVDHTQPLPRPPEAFGAEFSAAKPPVATAIPVAPDRVLNRAELAAQIERLKPQMETYHTRMNEINADFELNFTAILTPEQNAVHQAHLAAVAPRAARPVDTALLTDEQISGLLQRPLMNMFRNVALQLKVESLNKEITNLTPDQQEKVMDLLRRRREKFLALVDSVPPPSLYLLNLAPAVQRLAAPKGTPPTAAVP
jgi:hypothetical protein